MRRRRFLFGMLLCFEVSLAAVGFWVSRPYAKLAVRWNLPDAPTILDDGSLITIGGGSAYFCVGYVCQPVPNIFTFEVIR